MKPSSPEILAESVASFEQAILDLKSAWTPDRLVSSAQERKGDTAAYVLRLTESLEQAAVFARSILVSGSGSVFSPFAAGRLQHEIEAIESALAAGPTSAELTELQEKVALFDALQTELCYLRIRARDLDQLQDLEGEHSTLLARVDELKAALHESGVGEVENQARVICAKVGATVSELEAVLSDRLKELMVNVEVNSRRLSSVLEDLATNRQKLEDAALRYNEILPEAKLHAEANAKIAAAIGPKSIAESVETIIAALGDTDRAIKEALEMVEASKKLPELGVAT